LNQLALKGDLVIADGIQKYIIGLQLEAGRGQRLGLLPCPDLACSSFQASWSRVRPRQPDQPQIVLLGEYGHALSDQNGRQN